MGRSTGSACPRFDSRSVFRRAPRAAGARPLARRAEGRGAAGGEALPGRHAHPGDRLRDGRRGRPRHRLHAAAPARPRRRPDRGRADAVASRCEWSSSSASTTAPSSPGCVGSRTRRRASPGPTASACGRRSRRAGEDLSTRGRVRGVGGGAGAFRPDLVPLERAAAPRDRAGPSPRRDAGLVAAVGGRVHATKAPGATRFSAP